jgi:hypothetical protein
MQGFIGEALYYAKLALRVGRYFQVLPSSLIKLTFNIELSQLNFKKGKS